MRRVTCTKMGDGGGEGDEAEEFNIWWHNKLAFMANSNGEPVISGTMKKLDGWRDGLNTWDITSILVFIVIVLFWNKMKLSTSHIPWKKVFVLCDVGWFSLSLYSCSLAWFTQNCTYRALRYARWCYRLMIISHISLIILLLTFYISTGPTEQRSFFITAGTVVNWKYFIIFCPTEDTVCVLELVHIYYVVWIELWAFPCILNFNFVGGVLHN